MSVNYRRKRTKIVFFGAFASGLQTEANGYLQHLLRLLREADLEDKYELITTDFNNNEETDLLTLADREIFARGADIAIISTAHKLWLRHNLNKTDEDFTNDYKAITDKLTTASIKTILLIPVFWGEENELTDIQVFELKNRYNLIEKFAAINDIPLINLREIHFNYQFDEAVDKEQLLTKAAQLQLRNEENFLLAAQIYKVIQQVN